MKISRIGNNKIELDGTGELVLTHNPHQFELKGMYEHAEPLVDIQHFRTYRAGCCWRCNLRASMAALKFIWRR